MTTMSRTTAFRTPRKSQRNRSTPDPLVSVFQEQYPRLVRTATMIVGSQAIAEELVQDAFMKLRSSYTEIDNPPAFLHTVVTRHCYDYHRHQRVVERHLTQVTSTFVLPPELDEMWNHLQRLSPDLRTTLVLRYYDDLSVERISEIMDCPSGTTKSRINRGLKQLRQEIDR